MSPAEQALRAAYDVPLTDEVMNALNAINGGWATWEDFRLAMRSLRDIGVAPEGRRRVWVWLVASLVQAGQRSAKEVARARTTLIRAEFNLARYELEYDRVVRSRNLCPRRGSRPRGQGSRRRGTARTRSARQSAPAGDSDDPDDDSRLAEPGEPGRRGVRRPA
jgi:hypothetical protein